MTISNTVIIPDEINRKLKEYARLIYEHNKTTNITGLKDTESIYNELILGSITPLKHVNVPRGTSFIDIGTGAGIPGIPLLLYFGGNIKGVLVDSNNKKIKFLLNAINTLGINDIVTVIQGRVEEIAKEKAYRDSFDFAVARAFAHPLMALEYGLPFVKPGGWLYIYYSFNLYEKGFENNKTVCSNDEVIAEYGCDKLHEEKNANKHDITVLTDYLTKHSLNLGGHRVTLEEAKKLKLYEGLIFLKDGYTPANYPRKHAVVKREVESLRNIRS
ncbi:MAG TPA: 16S rRNA (guanine(527)-N(7))-methyltransferase RsmG [Spirochaetota bacterium]|nr:16S rRNA (guanine(527)-N(7))-methyltransferase RsmG [Spirochaetota bacterium]HOM09258.1 16S rRNA (guanine(527)-N(7))-methyltransferase RsmG [Spirochaetota bacterium]HPP49058.1 16S rRNA (guanine(527)-N(7))-methyltransferase RsmG [Spirochaetota bacterium]